MSQKRNPGIKPQDIYDNVLEDTICKVFSLTSQEVVPEDLHACHQMSNRDRVIVKFKDRKLKHNVQIKRKNLHQRSLELSKLKFSGKRFVRESMCLRTISWLTNVENLRI